MNRKKFYYPRSIKITKMYCKVLIPLLTLLTIFTWLSTDPAGYQFKIEYFALLITIPIFPIFCFWFLYSWSDIEIDEEGIWVEFIGRDILVPWNEIISVQFIGPPKFGVWLIRTERHQLTFFHRIYSLFYARSNQPGFVIHPQINSVSELTKEIKTQMAK
jgi:hypothetical protein